MGNFLEHPACRLVPSPAGAHAHWFGGTPTHKGAIPPGREHPVHLLYDLDLTDPCWDWRRDSPDSRDCRCTTHCNTTAARLSIASSATMQSRSWRWKSQKDRNGMPTSRSTIIRAFPRTPIQVVPVATDVIARCITPIAADGGADIVRSDVLQDSCLFPRVGGRQFMWQGIPDWACPTPACPHHGTRSDAGKEVFAVIWERPIPELHLWTDDPKYQDIGSAQIIFSRCTGCGIVHSCNRCD